MSPTELQHVRLGAQGRDARGKISDAIALLRTEANFCEHDRATICVGLLRLPSCEMVGLVEVVFEAPWVKTVYRVPLRTAARLRGRRRGSAERVEYDAVRFNLAEVDFYGLVTLASKTALYGVEVCPASMLTQPSELDWRIIHAALKVIDGGHHCYRSLPEGLLNADPQRVPGLQFLDCNLLRGLKPPPLKDIMKGIERIDSELRVSGQKVADALRRFGVRIPAPRPRVKARERAKA
jgi:hypothetical protein